jgi:ABC-type multidrug transport system fused ATPase/permease subunit
VVRSVYYFTYWFLGLAVFGFIANFLQVQLFAILSEQVTFRVRRLLYQKILNLHIGFFDKESNKSGALAARLSNDCTLINSLLTMSIGV